jgi:hypothetical protein
MLSEKGGSSDSKVSLRYIIQPDLDHHSLIKTFLNTPMANEAKIEFQELVIS